MTCGILPRRSAGRWPRARCYYDSTLAVNGADALAAGIREGVAVGAALEELLEKVIEGTLPNSRGVLLEQLASMGGTGADSCEQESLF